MSAQDRPLLTTASITGGVAAVITLLVAFGLNITSEQTAAILGVVGVVAPFVVWRLVTDKETANSRVVEEVVGGDVVIAGPANELPTGLVIRTLETASEGPGKAGPGNYPGGGS